jgi:hypothetical protein
MKDDFGYTTPLDSWAMLSYNRCRKDDRVLRPTIGWKSEKATAKPDKARQSETHGIEPQPWREPSIVSLAHLHGLGAERSTNRSALIGCSTDTSRNTST